MTTFSLADDGHGTASIWVREPDGYLRAIVSSLDLPPDSRKYWPELVALVTGQPAGPVEELNEKLAG